MAVPTKILELVKRFDRNLDAYKQGRYNETQIRREFIDPFFEELSWDVANKQGYAEAYKDVVHEESIRVGQAIKAPDYGFRIGGVRKFFLETKKPSINIKEDTHPTYQLRRYKEAEETLQKAIESISDNATLYGSLGWIFYLIDKLDESIEASHQGLSIDSSQTWIQFNLALVLLCKGDTVAAKEEYLKGIEMADSETLESVITDLKGALEKDSNLAGAKEILAKLTQAQQLDGS